MQITDLLVPERVALNMQVADKAMAIHAMVGMLDRTGCLRDAVEYEKNVLEREAQGTTGAKKFKLLLISSAGSARSQDRTGGSYAYP